MTLTRRKFVTTAGTALAVVGFDPIHRTWVTEARANDNPFVQVPNIDGELRLDDASLADASDDFGHIITRTPIAVLLPGSTNDVMKLVKFANAHGIKVAGRGAAHSTFGQGLVEGGLVIDTRTLDEIEQMTENSVLVGAGVRWSRVYEATLPQGLAPPVATDYIETTVAGTLAVGGIGGASHRFGMQIDNVLELEVVTGRGHKRWCSPTSRADLFESVLGGLGQFAIVVRARIKLVSAEARARAYTMVYEDLATYLADQRMLVTEERFSYLEGQIIPDDAGGWQYLLEAVMYYTAPNEPDDAALTGDLSGIPQTLAIEDVEYFEWINRLAPLVEFLKLVGAWDLPHPWFDVFLSDTGAEPFVEDVFASLTTDDTGSGPILLYPFSKSKLTRPFFAVPEDDDEVAWLLSILRFAPPVPPIVDAMIASNRQMFEQARDLGGKRYPIGAIPFAPDDWEEHLGPSWDLFVERKQQYDPNHTLTPGHDIFDD
jgi:cytokinin dehydrogenase